jgi:hypothetical protein
MRLKDTGQSGTWACNPRTQKLRQEDGEFKASPGYKGRLCLQNKVWGRGRKGHLKQSLAYIRAP